MSQFVDTLPPARDDYRLDFMGLWTIPSWCRIRVYRPSGRPVIIVATELLGENTGTSVTNRAELVHAVAWYRACQPVPVRFVEHYPGDPPPRGRLWAERWAEVRFPLDGDGFPARVSRHAGGPGGEKTTMFGPPEWRHITREAFFGLIQGGAP